MLTLKEPIRLRCLTAPQMLSETFCQRILGNYSLLGAHFGPRDLLFLLTAPPELPNDLGGMTTLVVQNSFSDNRSMVLDVVNHVVNRILLLAEPGFTYQDQVYLSTALHKLGITDAAQFIGEVRALREEEHSVVTLLSLYREEAVRDGMRPPSGPDIYAPRAMKQDSGETQLHGVPPRYYLHEHLYRRLQTGAVYALLNSFHQSLSQVSPAARGQFLRLSEELRVSNLLALNELRSQVFHAAPLTLSLRLNHYELGDLLPPPDSEEAVLSQAAEAALFSTVEHVLVQRLSQSVRAGDIWQDLRQSLSGTVEHTLSRYEAYRGGGSYYTEGKEQVCHSLLTQLHREEGQLLRTLRDARTNLERETRSIAYQSEAVKERLPLEYVSGTVAGEEAGPEASEEPGYPVMTSRELNAITRNLLESDALSQPLSSTPGPCPGDDDTMGTGETRVERWESEQSVILREIRSLSALERELVSLMQEPPALRRLLLEHVLRTGSPTPVDGNGEERAFNRGTDTGMVHDRERLQPADGSESGAESLPHGGSEEQRQRQTSVLSTTVLRELLRWERQLEGAALPELIGPPTADDRADMEAPLFPRPGGDRPLAAEILRREWARTVAQAPSRSAAGGPESGEELNREPGAIAAEEPEGVTRILATEGGTEREELLLRQLTVLDRQNREVAERLRESRGPQRQATPPAVPASDRTMAAALLALDNPGQSLWQLLSPQEERPEREYAPAETALLLRHTDETTRSLLERAMLYERDPEAAAKLGSIRPGVLGVFNAEAAGRDRETLELIARMGETIPSGEPGGGRTSASKTLGLVSGAGPGAEPLPLTPERERTPLRFVHKQGQEFLSEELVARLEEQRRATSHRVETVADTVQRYTAPQAPSDVPARQAAEQTAEEVNALVSRTLARQMSAITDKVYQQMERRLQTERQRRGRY